MLVQFSSAAQAGSHGIADFVFFPSPTAPILAAAPCLEELAKILSPESRQNDSGDIILPMKQVIDSFRQVGLIPKEKKHPLKCIMQRYSSIFSRNGENLILKKNADAETVKDLLGKFKSKGLKNARRKSECTQFEE